jgi:hypothetical protein
VTEQDLYRIEWLRDNGYAPYVMIYDKEHLPKGHELRQLQRWVNNRFIFWSCPTFDQYKQLDKNKSHQASAQMNIFDLLEEQHESQI